MVCASTGVSLENRDQRVSSQQISESLTFTPSHVLTVSKYYKQAGNCQKRACHWLKMGHNKDMAYSVKRSSVSWQTSPGIGDASPRCVIPVLRVALSAHKPRPVWRFSPRIPHSKHSDFRF